jgi:transcriptional regulator with XRE-family HTH domain
MEKLGIYLKKLREEKNLSRRYVENQSKYLHKKNKLRQLSNVYLIKLENGSYKAPSPFKLKTLAQIYKVDYQILMELADYLDEDSEEDGEHLLQDVKSHLIQNGMNAEFF